MTDESHDQKTKTSFEDTVQAVAADVADVLDSAVEHTAKFVGSNKIVGGAAVGALAAIVLPFSIVTGALVGAGYAAYRKMNR